jgi:hypothetical protein
MEPVLPRHAQQLYYAEAGLLAFAASATFGSYANLAFTYVQLAIVYALAETGENLALEYTAKKRTTVRAVAA